MNIHEYTKEAAQKVVDRKTQQLVDSGKEMKNAENTFKDRMTTDGGAIQSNGQYLLRKTDNASSAHREAVKQGANLSQGALRILKAGQKKGCDTENLKYAGKGHAQEVNRQVQAHHDIKHMHEYAEALGDLTLEILEEFGFNI